MNLHLLQRAPRNADLGTLHLTFFVTAITTELDRPAAFVMPFELNIR